MTYLDLMTILKNQTNLTLKKFFLLWLSWRDKICQSLKRINSYCLKRWLNLSLIQKSFLIKIKFSYFSKVIKNFTLKECKTVTIKKMFNSLWIYFQAYLVIIYNVFHHFSRKQTQLDPINLKKKSKTWKDKVKFL